MATLSRQHILFFFLVMCAASGCVANAVAHNRFTHPALQFMTLSKTMAKKSTADKFIRNMAMPRIKQTEQQREAMWCPRCHYGHSLFVWSSDLLNWRRTRRRREVPCSHPNIRPCADEPSEKWIKSRMDNNDFDLRYTAKIRSNQNLGTRREIVNKGDKSSSMFSPREANKKPGAHLINRTELDTLD